MKKLLLSVLLSLVFFNVANARGRVRIPVGEAEHIETVAQLPENYKDEYGNHYNVCQIYYTYDVLLPIWVSKEPKLILGIKNNTEYYELEEEELNAILEENNLEKDKLLKVGFQKRYLGKIILLAIVAFLIWRNIPRGSKED